MIISALLICETASKTILIRVQLSMPPNPHAKRLLKHMADEEKGHCDFQDLNMT